jgi:hypothetical protein
VGAKNLEEFGDNVAKDVVESALSTAAGTIEVGNQPQNGRDHPNNHMRSIKSNRCVNIEGSDEAILKVKIFSS